MRINTKNKSKTILIFGVVLLIVVVCIYLWMAFISNATDADRIENIVDYNAATEEQQQAGYDAKKAALEKNTEKNSDTDATNSDVSMLISSVNQEGGVMRIRTSINMIDQDGRCHLTLTKPGEEVIDQSVNTKSFGSYSACLGFDIPTQQLSDGQWQLKIVYKGTSGLAEVQQNVEIKK